MRVYTSAAAVKDSPSKLAYVFQSTGCDAFYFQRVGRKVPQPSSTSGRHTGRHACLANGQAAAFDSCRHGPSLAAERAEAHIVMFMRCKTL